jgi:hypothetical protein
MKYCPRYKITINEDFDCIKCQWNLPITLTFQTKCTFPIQLEWTGDFTTIKNNND